MRNNFLSAILILGVCLMLNAATGLAAAQADPNRRTNDIADQGPHLTVLENGLNILTLPDDRFPLASLRLYVHAGSSYESPKQAGISHLLEHMVFKGTEKRAPGQVARDIESVGGYLNAATSFDYTVYYVDMPAGEWRLGLDVIKDMIFGAKIDPDELEQEKNVVLSELARGEDNPGNKLFKTLQSSLWKGTSYGWPIIGFEESVKSITRDDILDYIQRMYQPQRMLLVAVGDIDEVQVIAEAEKLWGSLKNDRVLSPPVPFPAVDGKSPTVSIVPGEWNKAYVSLAFPGPPLSSEKAVGLEVLAHILGGDDTSRLYRTYKYEKRMVDSIFAYSMTLERSGMILIQATMDADKVEPFLSGLSKELADLPNAQFDDDELERAKLNIEDSLFRAKETLSGLAGKVGYFQFFENGQEAEQNFLYSLDNVDQPMLQNLALDFIHGQAYSAALLMPQSSEITEKKVHKSLAALEAAHAKVKTETAGTKGQINVVDLGRGNTLVLMPDSTLPYTSLSMAWPGGDTLLRDNSQGLSDLLSRALTRGTANMTAVEIQDFLSNRAAGLSASSGRDTFRVSATYPSRFAPDIGRLILDTITEPAFAPEEIDRAIQEQTAAIVQKNDQPLGLAFRNLFPFLYSGPGYGYYHLGQIDQVATFTPDEIRDLWKTQRSEPFVMSVCGDFDEKQIRDLAEELTRSLSAESPESYSYPTPLFNPEKELSLTLPGRNQTHILRIFPVPGLDNPDSAGLSLLRAALAGQSGILFSNLRDKQGLGYTVTAFLWQAPDTGFMAFYIGTSPEKRDQAVQGFSQAIADLAKDPLPESELKRAHNVLLGEYYRENQSLGSRAGEASSNLVKGLPVDHAKELIDAAANLTPEDLRALAEKYFVEDNSYLVTVTP